MTLRITRLAQEVDGVAIGAEQVVVTQANRTKGAKGDTGDAATVSVGSVTKLSPGATPTVVNTGTSGAAVFDFGIPEGEKGDKGDKGDDGDAATIEIGAVTTLPAGSLATVENVGTPTAAILNLALPKGADGTGAGDVIGPAEAVAGHIAVFADGTGKVLEDGGAPPEPGLVLIEAMEVTSPVAAIDFVNGIDGTYDGYEIRFYNVRLSTESSLVMQVSSNGGTSFDNGASDYTWIRKLQRSSAASTIDGSGLASAQSIEVSSISIGNSADEVGCSGVVRIMQPSVAQHHTFLTDCVGIDTLGNLFRAEVAGRRKAAAIVNAVRFFNSFGNVTSGAFALYGVRKS